MNSLVIWNWLLWCNKQHTLNTEHWNMNETLFLCAIIQISLTLLYSLSHSLSLSIHCSNADTKIKFLLFLFPRITESLMIKKISFKSLLEKFLNIFVVFFDENHYVLIYRLYLNFEQRTKQSMNFDDGVKFWLMKLLITKKK